MDKLTYICLLFYVVGSAWRIIQMVKAINNHAQVLMTHQAEIQKLKKQILGYKD